MNRANRIAVVQYRWELQSYSRDFVIALAEHGYAVDFFIDGRSLGEALVDPNTVVHPNVAVHSLRGNYKSKASLLITTLRKVMRRGQIFTRARGLLVCRRDLSAAQAVITSHQGEYIAIVGIEKGGFIFAGLLAERVGLPLIYYSLELYFDRPDAVREFRVALAFEQKFHRLAHATIVQDPFRAKALFQHNRVRDQKTLYLPVSVRSAELGQERRYWHKRFGLSKNNRVVLYFGMLDVSRRPLNDLVDAWRQCSTKHVLIMHGNGDASELRALCARSGMPNVFVSIDLVPEDQIPKLIASADIGVCIYDNDQLNDRLTAFSSQKLALCMRAGVPVITRDNESYRTLFGMVRCGEALASYHDIPIAIDRIFSDFMNYRRAAFSAYETFFSFENNFSAIAEFFAAMSGRASQKPHDQSIC